MASLLFYLSATVLLSQSTVAFNCSAPPIYVDIHKRAVHGIDRFQYGSFIGVGSPAQNQSLWPSLSQNHTSFTASTYCDNSTLNDCSVSTGGFFDRDLSQSFSENKNFKAYDKQRNGTFTGIFGQDDIHLYTHYFETDGASQTLLTNSTIEVAQTGVIAPSIVGIGQSSTVLDDLFARGIIAGRTYSLYIGQGMNRAGGVVNGSNVFGGYDAGRFTGPLHKYPMKLTNMNPMTVRVNDIIITDSNNPTSNISLFDTTKFPSMKTRPNTFEAQITTDQYPLSLPYEITQNFISQLSAEEDNTWGDNSLKLKNPFNGTLSIVLDDGFTVTLPPEVLMNASNITPIQSRKPNSTEPFYLSTAFLGQVYLMADFDSYSFYLAQAVIKNNAVMPETFCPKTTPVAYERPKQSKWVSQGLIGAVIGGVFGGLGLGICAFCFVMALRRRRDEKKLEERLEKGKQAKLAQFEVEDVPVFDPPPKTKGIFAWKKR
ncbi:aspartic peptidase domain-containing protein [Clohesyomyces aquaticus]|uniref:Aspartic peptidase domain-containing protein n=1 Tax=Clohesyomyces aquaticus TaxID=1231657 RepID=A0A1Y2A9X0_9PLEO|nr:aspartic peptidase domain-containing protein [Clohesyomyces aquaticus]